MKIKITLIALLAAANFALAQSGDDILGTWFTEDRKAKVKVYKDDGYYFGKIIWLKDNTNDDGSSPKLDKNNPNEEKRDEPIVGTLILEDLVWENDDEEWDDGEIYDPKTGNTYSVYARLESKDKLYLKGYIGISLIGRSTNWYRIKD